MDTFRCDLQNYKCKHQTRHRVHTESRLISTFLYTSCVFYAISQVKNRLSICYFSALNISWMSRKLHHTAFLLALSLIKSKTEDWSVVENRERQHIFNSWVNKQKLNGITNHNKLLYSLSISRGALLHKRLQYKLNPNKKNVCIQTHKRQRVKIN